jgi:hypothetical protein
MTSLVGRTVPFRRRSLQQMTASPSGPFGGTASAGGGFFSSSSVSATPTTAAAAKCRSVRSSCSTSTFLPTTAKVGVRSGGGTSSITRGRTRHLHSHRRATPVLSKSGSVTILMGGGPSSALSLSSASRSARIRPRSYSTTPAARQQHPKQPGSQKRSQSTIIGVPGGPPAGGGAGAGNAGPGASSAGGAGSSVLGGVPPQQAGQATWKEIFRLLRERCNVFLLKPRRMVS